MILTALIAILGLYIFFVLLQGPLRRILKKKICAVCGAVLATWLFLFALWYATKIGDPILIALLAGQSIAGAMYLFDSWVRKSAKELIPLKIAVILIGTAVGYLFLGQAHAQGDETKLILFFAGLLALAVGYLVFAFGSRRGTKRSEIEKKLEDCC